MHYLDGFRGFVVLGMVIVNNPGDPQYVYPQLAHVLWDGMSFADTIAAWFLWVIGVTTALSLTRRLETTGRLAVLRHVTIRAAVLYVCGLALVAWPALLAGADILSLDNVRLMGILQRIAICYLLAGGVYLVTGMQARAVTVLVLFVGYWLVMTWIPGPAGSADAFSTQGNRAFALDHLLLGPLGNTYSHSLLTISTATASVLLGSLAGEVVRSGAETTRKSNALLFGGLGLIALALLISQRIPVNRNLWTPPYVLLTSGAAMVALAAIMRLDQIHCFRRLTGWLVAYGANPLLIFLLSEFGRITAGAVGIKDASGTWHPLWMAAFDKLALVTDPYSASALFALFYAGSLGVVAAAIYSKGWILKV